MLAADLAGGVEALDADVVEIAGTVHGRARVRLGDDQEVGHARVRANLRRQRREARRDVLARVLAQDAEARARDDPQRVLAVDRDQVVAAVAEEREVVVGEPAQERLALGELLRRDRRRAARRSRRRSRSDAGPASSSSRSTARRTSASTRATSAASASSRVGLDDPVDLDVDERLAARVAARPSAATLGERAVGAALHRDDRMDDEMQRQAVPVDFHRHRVDEERHVVVDDLDDRVRRLPAVLLDRRIEDAHAGVAGLALAREVPVRQRRAVQVGRRALREVLGIDLPEIAGDEALEHVALAASARPRARHPASALPPRSSSSRPPPSRHRAVIRAPRSVSAGVAVARGRLLPKCAPSRTAFRRQSPDADVDAVRAMRIGARSDAVVG